MAWLTYIRFLITFLNNACSLKSSFASSLHCKLIHLWAKFSIWRFKIIHLEVSILFRRLFNWRFSWILSFWRRFLLWWWVFFGGVSFRRRFLPFRWLFFFVWCFTLDLFLKFNLLLFLFSGSFSFYCCLWLFIFHKSQCRILFLFFGNSLFWSILEI